MKVLVVGSGGREHALVWKIAQSPLLTALHAAPGSAAIGALATLHAEVKANDLDGIVALAKGESIDLVVVGPEDPLAAGLADHLRERAHLGLRTFRGRRAPARGHRRRSARSSWQRHDDSDGVDMRSWSRARDGRS